MEQENTPTGGPVGGVVGKLEGVGEPEEGGMGGQKETEQVDCGGKEDHWVQLDWLQNMDIQWHQMVEHMEGHSKEAPITKQEPDSLAFHKMLEEWTWQGIQHAHWCVEMRAHKVGCG